MKDFSKRISKWKRSLFRVPKATSTDRPSVRPFKTVSTKILLTFDIILHKLRTS